MWDEVQGPYGLPATLVTDHNILCVCMGTNGIRVMDAGWWPCGSPISLFAMRIGMGTWAVASHSPSRGGKGWLRGVATLLEIIVLFCFWCAGLYLL